MLDSSEEILRKIRLGRDTSFQLKAAHMAKRGEGVPIILEESRKLLGREPVYRMIDDAELLLTIFSARITVEDEDEP